MSRIKELEAEIKRLRQREKQLLENMKIFRQIFSHLHAQFEELKKEVQKR